MKQLTHDLATDQKIETDLTSEQIAELEAERLAAAWATLRAERDRLLVSSDWTQVADAPVDATAWSIYRQALRDLPTNTTDPTAPVWPTPPA